ncbi:winged helix-turn-helix transcriptional regulator [Wenjunlia tyrosinilytica]|uniref:Transcriptional regulator n=1 Tax=Wenjunlia tyrosinilytica TaxID=1544741 RepID=A0A917ZMP7_9ACTN|nr:helix-turn-helix domain-containing protein [Wenjunlia tyrosinilytica]GGO86099.1 transcriptional regulator [Wenjunlia tyrosinilytica]
MAERVNPCDGKHGAHERLTRVFALLGKRWTGMVLFSLMEGPVHFSELRRSIPGISERMLSDRLTELGEAGLVVREVVEGPPLGVRYRLTAEGSALEPSMAELGRWAERCLKVDQEAAAE